VTQLAEDLGSRVMAGSGGVAEYGITVELGQTLLRSFRLRLETSVSKFADDAWRLCASAAAPGS